MPPIDKKEKGKNSSTPLRKSSRFENKKPYEQFINEMDEEIPTFDDYYTKHLNFFNRSKDELVRTNNDTEEIFTVLTNALQGKEYLDRQRTIGFFDKAGGAYKICSDLLRKKSADGVYLDMQAWKTAQDVAIQGPDVADSMQKALAAFKFNELAKSQENITQNLKSLKTQLQNMNETEIDTQSYTDLLDIVYEQSTGFFQSFPNEIVQQYSPEEKQLINDIANLFESFENKINLKIHHDLTTFLEEDKQQQAEQKRLQEEENQRAELERQRIERLNAAEERQRAMKAEQEREREFEDQQRETFLTTVKMVNEEVFLIIRDKNMNYTFENLTNMIEEINVYIKLYEVKFQTWNKLFTQNVTDQQRNMHDEMLLHLRSLQLKRNSYLEKLSELEITEKQKKQVMDKFSNMLSDAVAQLETDITKETQKKLEQDAEKAKAKEAQLLKEQEELEKEKTKAADAEKEKIQREIEKNAELQRKNDEELKKQNEQRILRLKQKVLKGLQKLGKEAKDLRNAQLLLHLSETIQASEAQELSNMLGVMKSKLVTENGSLYDIVKQIKNIGDLFDEASKILPEPIEIPDPYENDQEMNEGQEEEEEAEAQEESGDEEFADAVIDLDGLYNDVGRTGGSSSNVVANNEGNESGNPLDVETDYEHATITSDEANSEIQELNGDQESEEEEEEAKNEPPESPGSVILQGDAPEALPVPGVPQGRQVRLNKSLTFLRNCGKNFLNLNDECKTAFMEIADDYDYGLVLNFLEDLLKGGDVNQLILAMNQEHAQELDQKASQKERLISMKYMSENFDLNPAIRRLGQNNELSIFFRQALLKYPQSYPVPQSPERESDEEGLIALERDEYEPIQDL